MKNNIQTILLFTLGLLSPYALAQTSEEKSAEPEAKTALQSIEVRDARDPYLRPYRNMLKGVTAFEKYHRHASQGELRFILRLSAPGSSMKDVTLRIAGPNITIPVPIAEDGTFALPINQAAAADNADMLLNQKKETMRWRPYIRSPGLGANMRRLGDVRLECEVYWAIEQGEMSFLSRNAFNLVGGPCQSSRVAFGYLLQAKLQDATLVSGERRLALALTKNGMGFIPPLHDESWSDDALIELRYMNGVQ
jgi:hypothetical protein